ncbi:3-deoxy-D-manno-octulosonic acid transferase [Burkholderiales bacterium]|nr:3-deoxy-D-manno-octulosonic acid transferase [Burkholderiales bacterium]
MLERFGLSNQQSLVPAIWIHAVSIGEVLACQGLIERMGRRFTEFDILITCTTPGGRETTKAFTSKKIRVSYLPFDINPFISNFIKNNKPVCLLVMETEIWPTLFERCSKHSIPIFILNARLSKKSMQGYLKVRRLTSLTMEKVSGVLSQTEEDAARLKRIGGQEVIVTGNLKFDRKATPDQLKLGHSLRQLFGEKRHIIVAASTHEGEEIAIINSFISQCSQDYLLVLVPRHERRFPDVMTLIKSKNMSFVRRSDNRPVPANCRIVLGDSMGEMYSYYACSDLVIMGGSFITNGGQNPLEALSIGKHVITGPSTFNFSQIVKKGVAAKVIHSADNSDSAMLLVGKLLPSLKKPNASHDAPIQFVNQNVGALQKTVNYLEKQMNTWRKY